MFNKVTKTGMAALLLLTGASMAYAIPERAGKVDAGIKIGAIMPDDEELGTAFQIGGNIAYGVNEWFAIGFSGGWINETLEGGTAGSITIADADASGIPLFGELIFRMPTGESPFSPYGVVGIGTVIWDIDDTTATSSGTAFNIKTDVDTALAWKLGAGVDWYLNQNWAFNLEGGYVFSSPDVTVTASGLGSSASVSAEDLDLDYWTITAGVKFLFS